MVGCACQLHLRRQLQHETANHLPGEIIHKLPSVEISCYRIHVAVPRCNANVMRGPVACSVPQKRFGHLLQIIRNEPCKVYESLTTVRAASAESAAHGRARIDGKAREHTQTEHVRRSVNRTNLPASRPSNPLRVKNISSSFEMKPAEPTPTRTHAASCRGRSSACCGSPASAADACNAAPLTVRRRFLGGAASEITGEGTYQSLHTRGGARGCRIVNTLWCSCRSKCASAKLRTQCTNSGGRP